MPSSISRAYQVLYSSQSTKAHIYILRGEQCWWGRVVSGRLIWEGAVQLGLVFADLCSHMCSFWETRRWMLKSWSCWVMPVILVLLDIFPQPIHYSQTILIQLHMWGLYSMTIILLATWFTIYTYIVQTSYLYYDTCGNLIVYWDAKISIAQGQEGYDVLVGDSPDNRVMVDNQG